MLNVKEYAKFSYMGHEPFPDGDNLVVWSGGADSTLILLDLARQELAKPENERKPIYTLSLKWCFLHKVKMANENSARSEILKRLSNKGVEIKPIELEIDIDYHDDDGANDFINEGVHYGKVQQCQRWLFEAVYHATNQCNIWMGHMRGEDFFMFGKYFEQLLKVLCELDNKEISLCLPFMYVSKAEVLRDHIASDTINVVSTCENPKPTGMPCGECKPCRTRSLALVELLLDNTVSGKEHEEIAKLLKNEIGTISFYNSDK